MDLASSLTGLTGVMICLFGGAMCIGSYDVIFSSYSRHTGGRKAMITTEAGGLVAILILILLFDRESLTRVPSMWTLGLGLVTSISSFFGTKFLFQALNKGPISIVSPVSSAFALGVAFLTVLFALAAHQEINIMVLITTITMSLSIMYVVKKSAGSLADSIGGGVWDAIWSAVLLGIFYYGVALMAEEVGIFLPILMMRVITLCIALIYYKEDPHARRSNKKLPWKVMVGMILLLTLLDTSQFLSYNYASTTIPPSIASATLSTYPIFSVLFAQIWGGERGIITFHQRLALVVLLASVFVGVLSH
jgi:drug/metabolite transporter (DMT)-like permease